MKSSESLDLFAPAFVKMQVDIVDAKKEAKGRFPYADMQGIHEAMKPIMKKYGFAYSQLGASSATDNPNEVTIETIIMHESSQWISGTLSMPVDMSATQGNLAQAFGSIVTYCRRYSILAALGMTSFDDDGAQTGGEKDVVSSPKPKKPNGGAKKKEVAAPTPAPKPNTSGGYNRPDDYSRLPTNSYPAKTGCVFCKAKIGAEEGVRGKDEIGAEKWLVFCSDKDACIAREKGEPVAIDEVDNELPF